MPPLKKYFWTENHVLLFKVIIIAWLVQRPILLQICKENIFLLSCHLQHADNRKPIEGAALFAVYKRLILMPHVNSKNNIC